MESEGQVPTPDMVPHSENATENPWLSLVPKVREKAPPPPRSSFAEKPEDPYRSEAEKYMEEWKRKEQEGKAVLDVSIDRDKLSNIAILERNPNFHFETRYDEDGDPRPLNDEEKKALRAEMQQELVDLQERLLKLPERLQFQPGITLVVGENGAGKSTLAKALNLLVDYNQTLQHQMKSRRYDSSTESPYELAQRFVFEPENMPGLQLKLVQAGLAPEVAKAMNADDFYAEQNHLTEYIDFPEIIGRKTGRDARVVFDDTDSPKSGDKVRRDHKSHRQTVDQEAFGDLRLAKQQDPKPHVYFLDEPETGMSPRRHRNLEQEIMDATTENSIVIVPTNSLVLFESDLPRIDLDFPERGIHRPSQFPGELTAVPAT